MALPVRVGFVGTGGIAGSHLKQLQEIPEAQVVALCDIVEDRVQQRVQEFGGTPYTDYRAMLDPSSWTRSMFASRRLPTTTRS